MALAGAKTTETLVQLTDGNGPGHRFASVVEHSLCLLCSCSVASCLSRESSTRRVFERVSRPVSFHFWPFRHLPARSRPCFCSRFHDSPPEFAVFLSHVLPTSPALQAPKRPRFSQSQLRTVWLTSTTNRRRAWLDAPRALRCSQEPRWTTTSVYSGEITRSTYVAMMHGHNENTHLLRPGSGIWVDPVAASWRNEIFEFKERSSDGRDPR